MDNTNAEIDLMRKILRKYDNKSIDKPRPEQRYSAKVQKIGAQSGKDRLMIYITKAAGKLKIVKGDIVEFTLEKTGNEPIAIKNGSFKKSSEIKKREITSEETKFKEIYTGHIEKRQNEMAEFYKKKAIEQFGEARVSEILMEMKKQ